MYGKIYHDTFEIRNSLHSLFSQFFDEHSELDMETHNDLLNFEIRLVHLLDHGWVQ